MGGRSSVAILLVCGVFVLPVIPAANITITVQPGDLVVRERDPFTLSCKAYVGESRANNSLHYSWEKDGKLILNGSGQISVSHASTSDAGVYVCVVQTQGTRGTSTNVTITVISPGADDVAIVALIVCLTAIGVIFIIFFTSIGLYMCLCMSREGHLVTSKLCSCESHKGGRHREPQRVPARLSPSVPRRFTNRDRSKSKSLSQLLQANYPLGSNLCRSSSNLLTASQPTQVTDVDDPSTLNDLALDESMFEQSIPGTPSHDRSLNSRSHNKRKVMNKKGTRKGRRASEGTLVVPTTMTKSTSLKSILKESRSVNENLNEPGMRDSSAVSDVSSEVTHSDDNSLHLRKSVRFNVEEWAEDSGVHTGTSTPHYTPYPSLKRRASEPEAFGSHYSNGERRGSAPGDLASQPEIDTEECESREGGNVGDVDEGMATGSEQWGQQENDIDFERGKRFEGIFSSEHEVDAETQTKARAPRTDAVMSDNIASRVAQLYSAAQKTPRPSVSFTRGPSSLATSSYDSATISVAEVKKMLLERKDRPDGVTGGAGNEDGRRPGISKLPQERVEVFRTPTERLRTASLDRAQLRRGKPLNIGTYQALREGLGPMKEKVSAAKETPPKDVPKQEKKKESKATSSNPVSRPAPAPVAIPVFSGHSNLSNWVPACLRETVISPYHSYDDDNNEPGNTEEEEGESDSSDDRDMIMMEPLEPTVGTPLTSTGSIPTFGGVATMTPIGRSWLSSPNKTFGSSQIALPTKPIIPGGEDMSPFNESMHLQHGGHLFGAMKRLSVIPEETASACCSMTSMYTEQY